MLGELVMASAIASAIATQQADKKYLDGLSEADRKTVLAERKARWDAGAKARKRARKHAEKIEIAKAGRSRNF